MSAHDRYLAMYQRSTATVWCANPACAHHTEPVEVTYESEYGQGWLTPEECFACGGEWLDDKPDDEEGGPDDA